MKVRIADQDVDAVVTGVEGEPGARTWTVVLRSTAVRAGVRLEERELPPGPVSIPPRVVRELEGLEDDLRMPGIAKHALRTLVERVDADRRSLRP